MLWPLCGGTCVVNTCKQSHRAEWPGLVSMLVTVLSVAWWHMQVIIKAGTTHFGT
jgi:hypothetical protein